MRGKFRCVSFDLKNSRPPDSSSGGFFYYMLNCCIFLLPELSGPMRAAAVVVEALGLPTQVPAEEAVEVAALRLQLAVAVVWEEVLNSFVLSDL